MSSRGKEFTIYLASDNLIRSVEPMSGYYNASNSGNFVSDTQHSGFKVNLAHGGTLFTCFVISGAFFDENDTFVAPIQYNNTIRRMIAVEEGAVKAGLNCVNANAETAFAQLVEDMVCDTSVVGDII